MKIPFIKKKSKDIVEDIVEDIVDIVDKNDTDFSQFTRSLTFFDDPMLVANTHGIILYINRQLENLLGYKVEEVINNHVNIYLPNYKHETHKEQIKKFSTQNNRSGIMGINRDIIGKNKLGEIINLEITLHSLTINENPYVMARILKRYKNEPVYETIYELITDKSCVLTNEGKILTANNIFLKYYNKNLNDIINSYIYTYMPTAEDSMKMMKVIETINTDYYITTELIKCKDYSHNIKTVVWSGKMFKNLIYLVGKIL